MKIKIETPKGETLTLVPKVSYTIKNIKLMIQKEERIPHDQQRLVFAGKQLENSCTLLDCNIKAESKLLLEST